MRNVLGVVVAVVMVGCGGEPGPVVDAPVCDEVDDVSCPADAVAFCAGEGAGEMGVRISDATGCTVATRGPFMVPMCREGTATCDVWEPACVAAPDVSDPEACADWTARCADLGAAACFVPAGTDDVIPY